jgi:hypothetical protein
MNNQKYTTAKYTVEIEFGKSLNDVLIVSLIFQSGGRKNLRAKALNLILSLY